MLGEDTQQGAQLQPPIVLRNAVTVGGNMQMKFDSGLPIQINVKFPPFPRCFSQYSFSKNDDNPLFSLWHGKPVGLHILTHRKLQYSG